MMLPSKYQGSRHCGFRQEDFYFFISKIYLSLLDLDMQRIRIIRKIVKEGHIMIIPAKFVSNPASS